MMSHHPIQRRGRLVLAAWALAIFPPLAQAISADELVAKLLDARGGAAAIGAIHSLKTQGKLIVGEGFELAFTQYRKAPDRVRTEAAMQGLAQVMAWDGTQGWQISPFGGRKDPERMSADEAKSMANDAGIGGPLVDWRAQGSRIDYLGTEDVDGTDAHKIKVTLKNGDVIYSYLDPDHFLEIRRVTASQVRGTRVETTEDYGDYEKVAGVYFPFAITSRSPSNGAMQIQIDKAEANVPVDDALFAFPSAPAAKPSQSAGNGDAR